MFYHFECKRSDTVLLKLIYCFDLSKGMLFFFEWAKVFFFKKKKEQNQTFLNKSPISNGKVAKFSENDLLYDIN